MKKMILNEIYDMAKAYSPYQVFSDWICCSSLAIQNSVTLIHNKAWNDREQLYKSTLNKYQADAEERFAKMFVWLSALLEEDMTDALGQIFMEGDMGSKVTGQFFTPFHISELTARIALKETIESFDGSAIPMTEPSAGGGGMIIATAKVLKEAGINYQKYLDVVAQDLDWKSVYMCYLQCSLLGIKATVVQGDTLIEPFDARKTDPAHVMRTPAKMGALL